MSFYVEKVKRKRGRSYRIVRDVTRNGQRKREYITLPEGTSKEQADKICLQMSLEDNFGEYITRKSITLSEYAEQVYFPKYIEELSPNTQRCYQQLYYVKGGIQERLGNRYISEITTEVLQDLVNDYKKMGKSPKYIRNYVSLVSVILRMAKVDNYLRRDLPNPVEFLKMPKMVIREGNVYNMEQVMLMLQRAEETDNLNMQLILALTCLAGGLRRSEMVALRWEDISLEKGNSYIKVQRAAVSVNGETIEKSTKTKAGRRTIPIPSDKLVYNILRKAKRQYLKEQSSAQNFQGDNHVFIIHEEPYCPFNVDKLYRLYKNFQKKECPDLPHYRLHDLRHTYFTWCTEMGFSDISITATGGHSSIQSTRRYQHATMERMRLDMEKLEDVFEGVKESV